MVLDHKQHQTAVLEQCPQTKQLATTIFLKKVGDKVQTT